MGWLEFLVLMFAILAIWGIADKVCDTIVKVGQTPKPKGGVGAILGAFPDERDRPGSSAS